MCGFMATLKNDVFSPFYRKLLFQLLVTPFLLTLSHMCQRFCLTNKNNPHGWTPIDEIMLTSPSPVFIKSRVMTQLLVASDTVVPAPHQSLQRATQWLLWRRVIACADASSVISNTSQIRACTHVEAPLWHVSPAFSMLSLGHSLLLVGGCHRVWLMTPLKHVQPH